MRGSPQGQEEDPCLIKRAVVAELPLSVVESSVNVWEDVADYSREFIQKYLQQYSKRAMVRLGQGENIKT